MSEVTYTEESLLEEVAKANAFIQNQMLDTPEKVKDAYTRGMFLPMILNSTAGALWTLEVPPSEFPVMHKAMNDLVTKKYFDYVK